jgi:hypothetical protein
MSVQAAPGDVAVPAANGTGSVLCPWDAPEVVNLNPSPPSGTNRIDLIICQSHGQDIDGGTVDDFVITFVAGTEAASPVAPAVPAGAVALAHVKINGGAASIVAGDITDTRPGSLAVPTPADTPHYAMRYDRNTAFTFPATPSTAALVPLTAKIFDDVNAYNTTTGLYTCPAAGLYHIAAQLGWNMASSSAGYVITCQVWKNGVLRRTTAITQSANPGYASPQVTFHDRANKGDTFAMYATHSLANATGLRGLNETSMSIAYLGPS